MPHSFVMHRGDVGKSVLQLEIDMRHVMEPYTASKLKVTWSPCGVIFCVNRPSTFILVIYVYCVKVFDLKNCPTLFVLLIRQYPKKHNLQM